MITEQGIQNLWKTHVSQRYAKLARARPYAMTPDAKRFLCWLWVACEKLAPDDPAAAGKLFESALVEFADQCGINCLQPKPPSEVTRPVNWKDLWSRDLPNPFDKASPDLQGQSLLAKRDPELAKWLKKFAESPYAAACEWKDAEAKLLKQQAVSYDADTHTANIFANGTTNQTDIAAFHRNASPEVIARCRWEAEPVTFPGTKNSNLTQQSKISTIPRLSVLWDGMVEAERQYVASEKATLQRQRQEAELRLKALESSDAAPIPPRMASRARIGAE